MNRIDTQKENQFHLKTLTFKWWWWWWQLIFHSVKNMCMHQLTNCTFPSIRYLICKYSNSIQEIQGRNLMPRNQLIWLSFYAILHSMHSQSSFYLHFT